MFRRGRVESVCRVGVDMLAHATEREIADPDKRHVTDNNLALVAFAVLVRLLVR